jgi:tetratricopeptide (TPR) repeat protein
MRKIILLFAAIVLSRSSYSQQNQIDSFKRVLETAKEDTSKVNALNKVTSLCLQTPPDYKKALLFAEKSKLLAEKLSYKKGIAIAHHYLGIIYDYFGLYEKAFQNYLDGLKIWETLKDSGMIIQSYQNLSSAYSLQKQYKKALEIDWKLEKLAEANHDKQKIVFALWALAGDYSNICKKAIADGNSALANYNYEKSIELELRALKISTDIKDSSSIAVLYYSVGNIYDKCNLCEENKLITETNLIKPDYYNKAEESYFKSLEIYQQLNDEGGVSTCYLNLGFFLQEPGKFVCRKK